MGLLMKPGARRKKYENQRQSYPVKVCNNIGTYLSATEVSNLMGRSELKSKLQDNFRSFTLISFKPVVWSWKCDTGKEEHDLFIGRFSYTKRRVIFGLLI